MSKVILYIASSVDGFIARPDGDASWLTDYGGEDYEYYGFFKSIDAIVMGAKTYETILRKGVWPYKGIQTFVLTKHLYEKLPEADVTFFTGELQEIMTEIRKNRKKHIWLMGGGALIQSMLREYLVDEMMLFVMPILLGGGISLFGSIGREIPLRLLKTKSYATYAVLLHYTVEK